ncbi:hypothetical protein MPH_05186 [Macrophomina phaseolina MS6]|uniref:Uncharacterized protein n=1 Tax=Macrophomina phaseolina (strain MS6) TaxID=1126212 RepID=K2SLF5_MACPH|nr:hypothetical protein MPH_05186 [Macrophomina phaseolina MS6]
MIQHSRSDDDSLDSFTPFWPDEYGGEIILLLPKKREREKKRKKESFKQFSIMPISLGSKMPEAQRQSMRRNPGPASTKSTAGGCGTLIPHQLGNYSRRFRGNSSIAVRPGHGVVAPAAGRDRHKERLLQGSSPSFPYIC